MSARGVLWCLAMLAVVSSAASTVEERKLRTAEPSWIVMDTIGTTERPSVEFDHGVHAEALKARGCEACHPMDDGRLVPELVGIPDVEDRDELLDSCHERCMGCHRELAGASRASGPVTCGECHVRRPEALPARAAMSFDYSLHARHALAYPETCEACHHVFDEELDKLVYVKGQEDGSIRVGAF